MTTKTKTTKKETPKYVGVNCDKLIFISSGPIQLNDDGCCIFPDKYVSNRWTTEHTDSKFKTVVIGELYDWSNQSYCTTYQEFIKVYPEFTIDSKWALAGKSSKHATDDFVTQVVFTLGDEK